MRISRRWGWILALAWTLYGANASDPWRNLTNEQDPNLPSDEVQFVMAGRDGVSAWIGTLKGLTVLRDGALTPVTDPDGKLANIEAWTVYEQPDGGRWIGHSRGALWMAGDQRETALAGRTVATIQRFDDATLWAIVRDAGDRIRLMRGEGTDWSPVEPFADRQVSDLIRDTRGVFWLLLDGDGVAEIDPALGLDERQHHLKGLSVTSVLTDSRGRTWCGLWGGGIMVREGGEWSRHRGRERSAVLSLVEDARGHIWAATSGNGVWFYDGQNWKGMLEDEGAVNLMTVTTDGRVWISSQMLGGLRYWDGVAWRPSLDEPLPMRCLVELPGGTLVAGGVLSGLYLLDPPKGVQAHD